jgi:large subunit ribosomal protein L22
MEVQAQAKRVKISPRKVRLITNLIRGLHVDEARKQLCLVKRDSAEVVAKLLESAIANASHNFNLDSNKLFVSAIEVCEGPTIHRFRPRAFGRSASIRKRMSHITMKLSDEFKKSK